MRNTMVDLLLVRVRFGIRLAYTLGYYTGIALCVAGVFAVLTLHSSRILQEVAT
jgi:hypothetical protein